MHLPLLIVIIVFSVIVGLFLLTFFVYFFNLDMKMLSKLEPLFTKHYDARKRNRKI
ncbi:MAG: hypothetical protein HUJ51_00715 [Eggerthellaceae bacterium]|nr:hypothetical protein [Eggerthellaceae bacterium]